MGDARDQTEEVDLLSVVRESGVRTGDDFDELASWAQTYLRGILKRFRIPYQEHDDILQEALLALYLRLEEAGVSRPRAYLQSTVWRRCQGYRRWSLSRGEEPLEGVEIAIDPDQDRLEIDFDVTRCIDQLDRDDQELVWLKIECGYSLEEIAEKRNQTAVAVESAWRRCLQRLRLIWRELERA